MPLPSNERQALPAALARILPHVVRPARYTGNEGTSFAKEWPGGLHLPLVSPDVYEEGGGDPLVQGVYAALNSDDGLLCERAFLPWPDMDAAMCTAGLPLFALESKRPLAEFDLVLLILPGELAAPPALSALDLADLLRRSPAAPPFVCGIGPATANPEPLAAFCDAFIIGDVTAAAVHDTLAALRSAAPVPRPAICTPDQRALPPLVTRPVVPFVEARRERGILELSHPPMYPWSGQPWHERSLDELLAGVEVLLTSTGYDHIHLSGAHRQMAEIVDRLSARYAGTHTSFSLDTAANTPELVDVADRLPRTSRGGLTINITAGDEDTILAAARLAFQRGWHIVRLEALVGAPSQTWGDVERLVAISRRTRDIGREEINGQAQVHVQATPFIARAHSPEQHAPLLVGDEWDKRVDLLSKGIRGPGLRLQWRGLETRLVEAALARGDRRLGAVIEAAWRGGMKRPDQCQDAAAWQAAFAAAGLEMATEAAREHPAAEVLPR